jgi:serine/threonine protein kinase
VSILQKLRHPNVVNFLGVAVGEKQIALVTEVMHYGNLFSLLHLSPEHATKKNKKLIKKMLKISTQTLKILKVARPPRPLSTHTPSQAHDIYMPLPLV